MFATLARATERKVSEFDAQGLANHAWAFATVNQYDEKLFAVLARFIHELDWAAIHLLRCLWSALHTQENHLLLTHLFDLLTR